MNEEIVNQTDFTSETHAVTHEVVGGMTPPVSKKNSSKILVIVGVLCLGGFALIGLGWLFSRQSPPTTTLIVTPSPTVVPVETTGIREQLSPLYKQIEELNPEMNEVTFPPIHFDVRMKDPKTK